MKIVSFFYLAMMFSLALSACGSSQSEVTTQTSVPTGEFTMGSDIGNDDEKPAHTVYLDSFYIDKFEVTNALYKAWVDAGACEPPRGFIHKPVPVIMETLNLITTL